MTDIDALFAAHGDAIGDLLGAAEAAASDGRWSTPRAPGKWSPQQVVEHVAISYEEGANVIAGRPSKLPSFPFFLRPLGKLFLKRVLKTGNFPKSKTSKGMDPAQNPVAGPASAEEAKARLDEAFAVFEKACRDRAAAGDAVPSPAFGKVSLEDYARFTELHTRHHTQQIPVGP